MKIVFFLGHPAHFHLFKNVIANLEDNGHQIHILNKKKDILDDLLTQSGLTYHNLLKEGRKDGKFAILMSLVKRNFRLLNYCLKHKPDLMIGSVVEITHVGKLLGIPSICATEDDYDVVPHFSKLGFPFATYILAPRICKTGKWINKTINYDGYHELAYLHPDHFKPDKAVVGKYFNPDNPYFILRFSKLNAYHDEGIRGIDDIIASEIVKIIQPFGDIYITSEREFGEEFEHYRISIDPLDIHHVMAFAKIYIGDSQTMAAEAGVLGTPFIRFNDFVGRISYLNELENVYKLGFGYLPDKTPEVYSKLNELLINRNLEAEWNDKREKMLSEKINVADFMTTLIDQYPSSAKKFLYHSRK